MSAAGIQRLLVQAWVDGNLEAFIRVKIDFDATPHCTLSSHIATTACHQQRYQWVLVLKDIFHIDINSLVDTLTGAPLLWWATNNGDADCIQFLLQSCLCDPDVIHEGITVIALACKCHMMRRVEPEGVITPIVTADERRRGQQLYGNTVHCSKLNCINILLDYGVKIDRRPTTFLSYNIPQHLYPWCLFTVMSCMNCFGTETLDCMRRMVQPEHDFLDFYLTDRGRTLCNSIVLKYYPLLQLHSYEDARSVLLADCFRKRAQAFLFCRWKKFDLLPCDITELLYDYVMIGDSRY